METTCQDRIVNTGCNSAYVLLFEFNRKASRTNWCQSLITFLEVIGMTSHQQRFQAGGNFHENRKYDKIPHYCQLQVTGSSRIFCVRPK
jgi:hypothetical protein